MTLLFEGLTFNLQLGSLSLKEKNTLSQSIKQHGGLLTSRHTQASCIVCSPDEIIKGSHKLREADQLKIPIVEHFYIEETIKENKRLDRLTLIMDGKLKDPNPSIIKHLDKLEGSLFDVMGKVKMDFNFLAVSNFNEDQIENVKAAESNYLPHMMHRFFYNIQLSGKNSKDSVSLDRLRDLKKKELNAKLEDERKIREQNEIEYFKDKQEKLERATNAKLSYEQSLLKRAKYQQDRKKILQEKEAATENVDKDKLLIRSSQILLSLEWKRFQASKEEEEYPELVPTRWLVLGEGKPTIKNVKIAEDLFDHYGDEVLPYNERKNTKPEPELYVDILRKALGLPPTKVIEEKKPLISHAGKKVFFGGIKFDDINEKNLPDDQRDQYINDRIFYTKKMIESFGTVTLYEEKWQQGYAFVVFEDKKDARVFISALKDLKNRWSKVKEIRKKIVEDGKDKIIAPAGTFYVRWPQFYQKMLNNKRQFLLKKKKMKK